MLTSKGKSKVIVRIFKSCENHKFYTGGRLRYQAVTRLEQLETLTVSDMEGSEVQ